MKASDLSNQTGGSLQIDGEFLEERMTERERLHDLFQERFFRAELMFSMR